MPSAEAQVLADRAERDAARSVFDEHYATLKADIEERGVGGRIADEALEQAKAIFDESVAVIHEHPGVIGGTILALALWFLRNPIMAWASKLPGPLGNLTKELKGD